MYNELQYKLERKIIMHTYIAAHCSQTCYNGGICIKPNICGCKTGYTGYNCTTRKYI